MASEADKIAQLQAIAGISEENAKAYLQAFNWDLEQTAQFVTSELDPVSGEAEQAPEEPEYTGPRTLDGRPAPDSSSSQPQRSSGRPQQKKKGVATLSSLGGGQPPESDDDDDDDEEEEDKKDRGDLFAGGEKSGLAVKDPSRKGDKREGARGIVNDIIAKARENARRGGSSSEEPEARPSRHWGAGQTLGGDGAESFAIPDPRGQAPVPPPAPTETQQRTIHLWQDGFSIDEGPLYRFDDPANQEALRLIRSGRAPLDLMNVRIDQPVDARIAPHDEPWRQLPRVYRPFGGEGRRLGSPVPGDGTAPAVPARQAAVPAGSASSSSTPSTGADMSQPTLMLRLQMPNGARLPARFNATQTVGDIYDFVSHAHAETRTRPFVVATTFPNKDHTDHDLVLGDMPEFKKGGTAVVKWV